MPACQLKWRPEGKWASTFPRGPLSCSPMFIEHGATLFKRVLDCWSSKTPPLPLLLQYVRVWISYCGDMPVVQQQGLRTFRYMGHPTNRSFDMVQIIHVSMYSNKDMPCLVQCSRGSLTPGHPTTPATVAHCPQSQVYNRTCTTARTWHRYSSHEQQFQMWHYKMRHVYGTKCGTCEFFSFVV